LPLSWTNPNGLQPRQPGEHPYRAADADGKEQGGVMDKDKSNLLAETIDILKSRDKTPADVSWVGVRIARWLAVVPKEKRLPPDPMPVGSWDDFAKFADFEYNAGYGGNEVQGNLIVVGDNWWLERGEYDGSEWWEFKTIPQKSADTTPLRPTDLHER
jgi:hypothetical protein